MVDSPFQLVRDFFHQRYNIYLDLPSWVPSGSDTRCQFTILFTVFTGTCWKVLVCKYIYIYVYMEKKMCIDMYWIYPTYRFTVTTEDFFDPGGDWHPGGGWPPKLYATVSSTFSRIFKYINWYFILPHGSIGEEEEEVHIFYSIWVFPKIRVFPNHPF